jgi:hypothetical protein
MVIEDRITIQAPLDKVWSIFTDMSCWGAWNRVTEGVAYDGDRHLTEGRRLSFCLRPFAFPIRIEPIINELEPMERVVWSGARLGVEATHEFIFRETRQGVVVVSRESFSCSGAGKLLLGISRRRLRDLAKELLMQLKGAAES